MEIEESGILDTWNENSDVIDVDSNISNNLESLNSKESSDMLKDDPKESILQMWKVSKKLNHELLFKTFDFFLT